ncbi:glycosyltransferase family 4 protein [Rheinheimera sp. D18]|uniref:glycosyltransferase family 4 protein n=1 Tax=Rheinheimera sp. D18 TaxID=2545632 RepID=UPI00104D9D36|nr:glycosyltransferase family 4 protein [Rheinheimera sp. D18]QBL09621.1 glycosyltransferase family 4 protein [Rheinheimera sp. D18]
MRSRGDLRIMEVVQSLGKGGRTVRFYDTVNALSQSGYQVIAVCFSPFETHPSATENVYIKRGKGKSVALIWQLVKLIRKYNIDIVHAHCESSQLYAGLAAKLCRIPAVGTFHRSRLECYNPSLCNSFINFALSHSIAVSEDRLKRLTNTMGLPENRCSVVYGGTAFLSIPPRNKAQARAELNIADEGKILLSIGHLGEIKGHQDTLRALALLNRSNVFLYIAGTGSEQERVKLIELSARLNLEKQVTFLGQITDSAQWLDACDIFVQPSHEEAFGLVFIEAGARRKPVVATHVGGIKEIIQHGETGLLVQPASPQQLADNLTRLLDNEQLCQNMADAGYIRVQQIFSIRAMTDSYQAIFNQLLQKEGS